MKKYIILSLLLFNLLPTSSLLAQRGIVKLNAGYDLGLPLGNFKSNYVSNISPRGLMGDVSLGINNKWAVGLGFGYQDFYQKYPRTVYDLAPNQQISAVLSNSIQAVPVMGKVTFTPLQGTTKLIQPYAAAGIGISFVTYNQYLGEFSSDNTSGGKFTAMADAGIQLPFSRYNSNTAAQIGVSYSYTKFGMSDAMNMNMVGIHAGLIFQLH
ncbi:outer membrane beta-barrel protein [Hydrotalea sp.]|uniref:outer membrane beta-barrel protein n=2 Tax=Hydrotalea sp. TaxID=2881279 RepID=UPI002613E420|nr:outer membrane beta-barrel protein [Hydrotalea sp.]